MKELKCPKCGSPMVLRVAKRGPNPGGKFYGCSRYPNCKATIPVENSNQDWEKGREENNLFIEKYFPRILKARERIPNYNVRFFETVALPEKVLEEIHFQDMGSEFLKAFSQWRVDFPIYKSEPDFNEEQFQVISVLEKILFRGRITLTSPYLEQEFKKMFLKTNLTDIPIWILESLAVRSYQRGPNPGWFDSKEEGIFYEEILPEIMGPNFGQFVLPQVEISSLLPPNIDISKGGKRVDFGIFHPELEEKIIVEIDGEQHKWQIEYDQERDRILQEQGYLVIRIQTDEIRKDNGTQLEFLKRHLSPLKERNAENVNPDHFEIFRFLQSFKLAHQIQVVTLQAIKSGFLKLENNTTWEIISDIDELGLFDKKESLEILKKSTADFIEILEKLGKIYSLNFKIKEPVCTLFSEINNRIPKNLILISFSNKTSGGFPTFFVGNIYFPFHIANANFGVKPLKKGLEKPAKEDLRFFLRYLFRKSDFWEGQYEGIARALQQKDTLLLLPTGAGKSLVYQLASFLLPGRTVIIDPIISLMNDQIENLAMAGIDRSIAITHQISNPEERQRALQLFSQGEYLFVFVAPERFQTEEFRESLGTLTAHTPIALIAIDEAHCISEWGHDFRTAYLNIGRTTRNYCKSNNYVPPLIAMTGTASRAVLKDVQRELQIEDFEAIITPKSFDRPELKFLIRYSKSEEKMERLKDFLTEILPELFDTDFSTLYQPRGANTHSGLIFCPHIGGNFGVEKVSAEIKRDLGILSEIYSGKEPQGWSPIEYQEHKHRVTGQFKRNKIPLLVCTKAFGMGIDKPNIRYTIHYGIPPSIESFYQEAGRAGRDRKTAYCCIFASNDYPERTKKLLDPNTPVEEIYKIVKDRPKESDDDITRILFFHTNAFRGIAQEKQNVIEVLTNIGDFSKKGEKTLPIPERIKKNADKYGQARVLMEKAIHRLLLIGIVSDYTINFLHEEFTVKLSGASKEEVIEAYGNYVASYLFSRKQTEVEKAVRLLYLPFFDFVVGMIDLLLHFVYEVIERGRRDRFYQMLLACEGSPSDNTFRQRILTILEETGYTKFLEEIINEEKIDFLKVKDLFGKIASSKQSSELRGEVSRYLGDYPDHPSLLMLRALSEIFSEDPNWEVAQQYFMASISLAIKNFGIRENIAFDFAAWAISNIAKRNEGLSRKLIFDLMKQFLKRCLARILVENLPIDLADIPAWFLLAELEKKCRSLILSKTGD